MTTADGWVVDDGGSEISGWLLLLRARSPFRGDDGGPLPGTSPFFPPSVGTIWICPTSCRGSEHGGGAEQLELGAHVYKSKYSGAEGRTREEEEALGLVRGGVDGCCWRRLL